MDPVVDLDSKVCYYCNLLADAGTFLEVDYRCCAIWETVGGAAAGVGAALRCSLATCLQRGLVDRALDDTCSGDVDLSWVALNVDVAMASS